MGQLKLFDTEKYHIRERVCDNIIHACRKADTKPKNTYIKTVRIKHLITKINTYELQQKNKKGHCRTH
jgi:hypothetical protein